MGLWEQGPVLMFAWRYILDRFLLVEQYDGSSWTEVQMVTARGQTCIMTRWQTAVLFVVDQSKGDYN